MTTGGSALGSSALGSTSTGELPPPSNFSIDATRASALELSWTLESTSEVGVRIYLKYGSGSYFEAADLATGTESHVLTHVDSDTDITGYVVVYAGGDESDRSNTASTTTPKASITGQITDGNNNAISDAVFIFEDGDGNQLGTATTDSDGTYAVAGIPEGTYEISVRNYFYATSSSTTVSVSDSSETSADLSLNSVASSGVAITGRVTDFDAVVYQSSVDIILGDTSGTVVTGDAGEYLYLSAADSTADLEATVQGHTVYKSLPDLFGVTTVDIDVILRTTTVNPGAVDLTWQSATDADTQSLVREELVNGSYTNQTTVASFGPSTSSYTDDAVTLETGYRWRVETTLTDSSTTTSHWILTTTPNLGLADVRIPSDGWYIDIAGRRPAVSSVRLQPTVNGTPSMQLDLPRDETWQQDQYDDADVDVWRDGIKQPLDDLDSRELTPGGTSMTLSGGAQLGQRVVARSDGIELVSDFVKRLIETHTSYTPVVDTADNAVLKDDLLQSASSQADLQAAFTKIANDEPLTWDGDFLVPLQTSWLTDLDSGVSRSDFSSGTGRRLDFSGDQETITINLDHTTDSLAFYARGEDTSADGDFISLDVEDSGGNIVGNIGAPPDGSVGWTSGSISGSYSAGSYDFVLTPDPSVDSGSAEIDVIAVVDDRYPHTFDNTLDEPSGHLNGPEPYATTVPLALEQINAPFSVDAVTISATTNSGDPLPRLGLRDEGDGSYQTASQTSSTSITYDTRSATVQGRVSVGHRSGLSPREQTPRLGYEPIKLDTVELRADLDTSPVFINRTFDEPLVDILREAMEVYDGAFEVREGDPTELHVSRIDGRPVDIDPDLTDTSVERDTSGAVDIAIVYAAAESITELPFTATQDQWEQLPLDDGRIVEQSETVRDGPSGTPIDRGDEYEIREVVEGGPPEIKLLTSVSDPHIDCRFKPRGYYEVDNVPQYPDEIVRDAPELNSKQMADLAAYQAVEGAYTDATIDATVELPPGEIGFDVIDALNVADLPGDDPYQVRDVEVSPQRIRVRLGAGQTAGEAIQEIRDRTSRVSERV